MRILTNDTDFYSGFDGMVYNHGYEECDPGHSYGPALRKSYMLHYISCGKGVFRYKGKEWHLKAGDAFFIEPGEEVYYEADKDEPWGYGWIGLQGAKIHEYLSRTSLLDNPVIRYDKDDELSLIYIRIARSFQAAEDVRDLLLNKHMYEFLCFLIENFPAENRKEDHDENRLVTQIMSYCLIHLDAAVTVDELADHFGMNRSSLSRFFKKHTGMTLKDYIWKVKEEEARNLLATTAYPIETVARSVGYEDPLYFSRFFKQKVGQSPTVYREGHTKREADKKKDE